MVIGRLTPVTTRSETRLMKRTTNGSRSPRRIRKRPANAASTDSTTRDAAMTSTQVPVP